jgi:hypothetical protein
VKPDTSEQSILTACTNGSIDVDLFDQRWSVCRRWFSLSWAINPNKYAANNMEAAKDMEMPRAVFYVVTASAEKRL